MIRFLSILSALTICLSAGQANGQIKKYAAYMDSSQVLNNESSSTATGTAQFTLNNAGTHLHYSMQFFGLDLEPISANRTDPNDIIAIHVHLHVADVIGPHILNVFGNPSEDDADLVVDYENESLTGIFDLSDASRDPVTGELLNQAFPLTTKVIGDWLDELAGGELYIAVHSRDRADNAPPGVDIRGDIFTVPEPGTGALLAIALTGLFSFTLRSRRRGQ